MTARFPIGMSVEKVIPLTEIIKVEPGMELG